MVEVNPQVHPSLRSPFPRCPGHREQCEHRGRIRDRAFLEALFPMVGRTGRVRHATPNEPGQNGVYQAEAAGGPVRGRNFFRFSQCDSVGGT